MRDMAPVGPLDEGDVVVLADALQQNFLRGLPQEKPEGSGEHVERVLHVAVKVPGTFWVEEIWSSVSMGSSVYSAASPRDTVSFDGHHTRAAAAPRTPPTAAASMKDRRNSGAQSRASP